MYIHIYIHKTIYHSSTYHVSYLFINYVFYLSSQLLIHTGLEIRMEKTKVLTNETAYTHRSLQIDGKTVEVLRDAKSKDYLGRK